MWNISEIPDQKECLAVVTGANAGLGYETTKALAKKKMKVVMACRSEDRAKEARQSILNDLPDAELDIMLLDLADLKSVRDFTSSFQSSYDRLDLLVNNAGLMMPPYTKTEDGYEIQWQVNYLSHFLLTSELLEMIEQQPDGRVVTVSSVAHQWGDIYFDDINFENEYDRQKSYGQSKLACLMFAYELDRRLKVHNYSTKSLAAHPGVSQTELTRHMPFIMRLLSPIFSQSAKQGAQPQLMAALSDNVDGGDYLGPDGIMEWRGKAIKVDSSKISKDKKKASRLWKISEEMTETSFLSG